MPLSKLLKNHRSFFLSLIQIQGQICIEDDDYCDFIVWMERDMHIERINPAVEFWKLAHKKRQKVILSVHSPKPPRKMVHVIIKTSKSVL